MNIPNHRPVLKGLLFHEHMLTRDFQGDQHFFGKDGSVAAHPTMPGSVSAPDAGEPVTQLVPHEDAPAFSDIATNPLTTITPTVPRLPMSLPQKDKNKGAEQMVPTTDSLTTYMTQDKSGTAGDNNPTVSLPLQRSQPQRWSAVPAEGTLATTSGRLEKGDVKETTLKNKHSPGYPIHEVNKGGTAMSITSVPTTTLTTMQTAGKPSCYL